MHVALIDSFDEFIALAGATEHLVDATHPGSVFGQTRFYAAYWATYGPDLELAALAISQGDRVVGLLPLVAPKQAPGVRARLRLELLGANTCDFSYFRGCENPEVMTAALAFMRTWPRRWSVIRFPFVPADSSLHGTARIVGRPVGIRAVAAPTDVSFWLDMSAEGGWEPAQPNRTMRNQIRRLREQSEFELREWRTPDEIKPRLAHMMHLHHAQWMHSPTPSKFRLPASRTFYRHLADELGERRIALFELRWDGRSIAYVFGFVMGRRYLLYTQTYDQALRRYSPGRLLNHLLLHLLKDREDCDAVDYMRGHEDYKTSVTNTVRPLWEVRWFARKTDAFILAALAGTWRGFKKAVMGRESGRAIVRWLRAGGRVAQSPGGKEKPEAESAAGGFVVAAMRLPDVAAHVEAPLAAQWEPVSEGDWSRLQSFFGAGDESMQERTVRRMWDHGWLSAALTADGNVMALSFHKGPASDAQASSAPGLPAKKRTVLLAPILSPIWSDSARRVHIVNALAAYVLQAGGVDELFFVDFGGRETTADARVPDAVVPSDWRDDALEFLRLRPWPDPRG